MQLLFFNPILYLLNTKPLVSAKKLSKSNVWVNCFDLVLLSAQHFNSVLGRDHILDQTLFHSPAKTIKGFKKEHVHRASLVWNDSFRKRDSLAVDNCSEKRKWRQYRGFPLCCFEMAVHILSSVGVTLLLQQLDIRWETEPTETGLEGSLKCDYVTWPHCIFLLL